MKSRYLLDTSALLAHLLQESGAEIVDHCLSSSSGGASICIITWVEFELFLKRCAFKERDRTQILSIYRNALTEPLPVDAKVGQAAIAIKQAVPNRIHLTDLLIAACAKAHGLQLVYRDKHIEGIPESLLMQIRLPAKE